MAGKNRLFDLADDDATLLLMRYSHPHKVTKTMTRLIAVWALILAWGLALTGTVHAADKLVHASSFKADARVAAQRQVPILILFSSPGCHYCETVKREYLIPMHKDPAYRKRVLIREVTVGATTPLTEFDGTITTEGAFAAAHKVHVVPTIMVFDTQGNPASEAIVGLLIPDFYFGYLESAIDEGLRKVRNNK
jgi:thioredoxin-related protein